VEIGAQVSVTQVKPDPTRLRHLTPSNLGRTLTFSGMYDVSGGGVVAVMRDRSRYLYGEAPPPRWRFYFYIAVYQFHLLIEFRLLRCFDDVAVISCITYFVRILICWLNM